MTKIDWLAAQASLRTKAAASSSTFAHESTNPRGKVLLLDGVKCKNHRVPNIFNIPSVK